jgi:hypothetical protein
MISDLIERVRAEYLEMPGLRLTSEQVQRLCGIEQTMCQMVLDGLVAANFLRLTTDRHYARATDGYAPRQRPAI